MTGTFTVRLALSPEPLGTGHIGVCTGHAAGPRAKLGSLFQPPGFACVTGGFLFSGGGDVKIESQKLNFKEKAQAKVGSLDNVGHLPAGGAVKVASGASGATAGDAAWPGWVGWCRWSQGHGSWVPVTAPQYRQESCPPRCCVFPVFIISPE